MKTTPQRPSSARSRPFPAEWPGVRRGFPLPAGTMMHGAGVGAGLATGSATLGMFWALLAGHVARVMLTSRGTWVTRLVRVAAADRVGVGVLAVTVSQWGRSSLAVAVAVAAGGLVSAVARAVTRARNTTGDRTSSERGFGSISCLARHDDPGQPGGPLARPGELTWR